jgi:ketosteroid isomerase-like protein
MTSADPRTVVVRYVEAVRDGDAVTIRASFATDATWEYPGDLPISRTWRGRDTIVDDFLGGVRALLRPDSPVVVELTNVVAEGDQVVAEWTSRATASSGASYYNLNVGIFTVRAGEIVSVREYTDTKHVADVLFPDGA